jgi:hypothetical protein
VRNALLAILLTGPALNSPLSSQVQDWPVHSMERPRPPVVTPPPAGDPAPPPGDAIVLFDGSDLSAWRDRDGGPARWAVQDGYMEVSPGSGSLYSARPFADVQLHIEWATPAPPRGEGQGRGNSGVFLMSRYEIQVLDSYQNDTYADGQAGALYGQRPPLVNASRPAGHWQTYDIVFRAPRFGPDGAVIEPARVTVLHNGVLIHEGATFSGSTRHARPADYEAHPPRLPLMLQDHGDRVRFRNIWVRELGGGS